MNDRILRRPEVQKLVGLSRSSLYDRIASGDFPRPVKLGGLNSRSVGWPESLVRKWIDDRVIKTEHQTQTEG